MCEIYISYIHMMFIYCIYNLILKISKDDVQFSFLHMLKDSSLMHLVTLGPFSIYAHIHIKLYAPYNTYSELYYFVSLLEYEVIIST